MSKEKKWEILNKSQITNSKSQKSDDIVQIILENRGLKTKKEIDAFLHADLTAVTTQSVSIDQKQLAKAIKRITKAIEKKEQVIVYGDYDVDGITGTAILWETLNSLGAEVKPYIPHRIDEGYGLSVKGIENVLEQYTDTKLIITVDNGIVANEAVAFANKKKIDVIITDHHTTGEKLPDAVAIVHTTQLCGAGVGYLLSQELVSVIASETKQSTSKGEIAASTLSPRNDKIPEDHLSLVALATVADLVSLTGANRILLKFGLAQLRCTNRPGILALLKSAEIEKGNVGVYEIGHIIAPRLNAMGRLESAMDSLRLLCTKDKMRAMVLADTQNRTNRERQLKTQAAAEHAIEQFRGNNKKLLFIAHEDYEEGVIGLVAGKLVEEYYLPAIVLSKGEKTSKASARSIAGFNIIEFIRSSSELLINAGGHPMAAGFTTETIKIEKLQDKLEKLAEEMLDKTLLQRVLKIDCEIPLEQVNEKLYFDLQQLAPFGMGNPEPTFVSSVIIKDVKTVGKEKQHLKLKTAPVIPSEVEGSHSKTLEKDFSTRSLNSVEMTKIVLDGIAFGQGDRINSLKINQQIDIVYTISENEWNGKRSLQLKIRDIK